MKKACRCHFGDVSCRARHQGRGHNQSVLRPPGEDELWCPYSRSKFARLPNQMSSVFSGFSCSLRRAHQSWISVTQLSRHRRAKMSDTIRDGRTDGQTDIHSRRQVERLRIVSRGKNDPKRLALLRSVAT